MNFHYHGKVSAFALCAVHNLNIFLHSYQRNAPKSLCITIITVTTTDQPLPPLYKVQASPLLAGHNFTQYIHACVAYVEMSAGSGFISAQSMLDLDGQISIGISFFFLSAALSTFIIIPPMLHIYA